MEPHLYPTLLCDFYKVDHRRQYPPGTEVVYSTWTPRASRIDGINEVVAFGFQRFVERLTDHFLWNFFTRTRPEAIGPFRQVIRDCLGIEDPDVSHWEALWELGYLPLRIRAVREGTLVPLRVPMLTIENTHPDFFWLTDIIEPLKDQIMARDGKVVIRPDSGDPVKIICGDPDAERPEARKGVIELLWDIFGGTETSTGYRQLDSHIGAIYGDAITRERCEAICEGLAAKGFASTNMVYGIGSYTYQGNTRDTFGFALKSTYARINGEDVFLFKDPVTDDGTKRSQRGRVVVYRDHGELCFMDGLAPDAPEEAFDLMETIYEGAPRAYQTFQQVRDRLAYYR